MRIAAAAFSDRGAAIALKLAGALGGTAWASPRYAAEGLLPIEEPLSAWAGKRFADCDALIFVGSCGIAVRAIAPHVKSKTTDPAVIAIDELGHNAVALLSGHIGGANGLAKRAAEICGGRAVITTATDINGITPPDAWAVENNCAIENLPAAKETAAALLRGERVGVVVTDELQPAPYPVTLWLRPKDLVIGVGCKKNADPEALFGYFTDFMNESGFSPLSVGAAASIEAKKDEDAIKSSPSASASPSKHTQRRSLPPFPGHLPPRQPPWPRSAWTTSANGRRSWPQRADIWCG